MHYLSRILVRTGYRAEVYRIVSKPRGIRPGVGHLIASLVWQTGGIIIVKRVVLKWKAKMKQEKLFYLLNRLTEL